MSKVLVPLAEGFEELEAVSVIDILRRAQIEVTVAGLKDGPVRGSRQTVIVPDASLDAALDVSYDMVVLPGGIPGSDHLQTDARIRKLLADMNEQGKNTAAICAAPKVLADVGVLKGRKATSYPGVLGSIKPEGVAVTTDAVVKDGPVITSRSVGTAMDFALALVEELEGRDKRDQVEQAMAR